LILYLNTDIDRVSGFTVEGHDENAFIVFTDKTPNNGKVETTYEIELSRNPFRIPFLILKFSEETFSRKDVENLDGGKVRISVKNFPGIKKWEYKGYFDKKDKLMIKMKVERVSPRLQGVSPIEFERKAKIRIP